MPNLSVRSCSAASAVIGLQPLARRLGVVAVDEVGVDVLGGGLQRGGEEPPNHSGGVGCWTGRSASLPSRTVRYLPSTLTVSPAIAARQIGIHSSV